MSSDIIQKERDTVFTEFNSEIRPWRLYTTSIYHDPLLTTDLSYLPIDSGFNAHANTLNIEAYGSDINFYTSNNFTTNFNNAVSFKDSISIPGELNVPGSMNVSGDIYSDGAAYFTTLRFGNAGAENTLPYGRGVSGQFLSTNGDGRIDWVNISGDTKPSVPGIVQAEKEVIVDDTRDISGFRNITMDGKFESKNYIFDIDGNVSGLQRVGCGDISSVGIIECANIKTDGTLTGPATFIIDPAAHGDNTGTVVIKGSLQVDGTTTTINSSILDISDHRIYLASNATNQTQTYGAGIEVYGDKTFVYQSGDMWESNIDISVGILRTNILKTETVETNNILIGSTNVNEATLNLLGADTPGIVQPLLAVVVDGNRDISGFNDITIDGNILTNVCSLIHTGSHGGAAMFSHRNFPSRNEGALYQWNTGATYLNAKPGEAINFQIGSGSRKMILTSDGSFGIGLGWSEPKEMFEVSGNIKTTGWISAGYGNDISFNFGNAALGKIAFNDWAGFSHKDCATTSDYALIQSETGITILNASATKQIEFKINDVEKARMTTDGSFGLGIINPISRLEALGDISASASIYANSLTSYGSSNIGVGDFSSVIGNASIGYNGLTNSAVFSHSSMDNTLHYAISQSSAGATAINSKDTQITTFNVEGVEKARMTSDGSFGLGVSDPVEKLVVDGNIKTNSLSTRGAVVGDSDSLAFFGNQSGTGCTDENYAIGQFPQNVDTFNRETRINSGALGQIQFWKGGLLGNGGVQQAVLTNGGNFGIGIQEPTTKLEVDGDISASGNIIMSGGIEIGYDTDVTSYFGRAAIGKVGIGATAPDSNFWSDQASFAHIENNTKLNFALKQDSDGETTLNSSATSGTASENGKMKFSIGLVEKMRLTDNGLGIGTGTGGTNKDGGDGATEMLEVSGNIKARGIIKAHVDSITLASEIGYAKFGYIPESTWEKFFGISHKDHHSSTGFGIRFGPDGHTALNAVTDKFVEINVGNSRGMLIKDNGGSVNVRIGSNADGDAGDEKLHVEGNIKVAQTGKIINDTFTTESDTNMYIKTGGATVEGVYSGDITRMTILGNTLAPGTVGFVGIGTSSPTVMLDVAGDICANGLSIGVANPTADLEVLGDISCSTTISVGKDGDTLSFIGKAAIGYVGQADWAAFSHVEMSDTTSFALIQSSVGETQLNSAASKNLEISVGGDPKLIINGTTGNVGIDAGTNPGCKLVVNGAIQLNGEDMVSSYSSGDQATNRTNTFIVFGEAGTGNDWAYLRQIGGSNSYTIALDFHDDGADAGFEIRDVHSTQNPDVISSRFKVDRGGNVGIGITNPSYKLEVVGVMKSLGVIYSSTATTKEWKTSVDSNGNLYFRYNTGNGAFSERGYFNQNANVNNIDFTGQHRSKFEGDFTSDLVGLIVESTGAYLELDGSVQPKIDEALPSVKLTTAAKSKRVYGVLSNIEGDTREYGSAFVIVVPKDDNITRVMVNSLGEGSLWVINTREQALENGDYICSSSVAGYGEIQDDDILHSYTVAKITMSLDWSNLPDWLETRNVTASGEVSETGEYKAAFVGVTYHCG